MTEFEHPILNEEITAIGGHYMITKEEKLVYPPTAGREILYFIGYAVVDTSCCSSGCGYAIVPGYLVKWHIKKSDGGQDVSLVEPIKEDAYYEVMHLIKSKEGVNQVHFLMDSGDTRVIY
ncbi:MAG: hypothetical protein J7L53_07705 [Deltaproteobacteria bacterium]|nr:hypothetical protein [Deltaproteobacteria bacterium]